MYPSKINDIHLTIRSRKKKFMNKRKILCLAQNRIFLVTEDRENH